MLEDGWQIAETFSEFIRCCDIHQRCAEDPALSYLLYKVMLAGRAFARVSTRVGLHFRHVFILWRVRYALEGVPFALSHCHDFLTVTCHVVFDHVIVSSDIFSCRVEKWFQFCPLRRWGIALAHFTRMPETSIEKKAVQDDGAKPSTATPDAPIRTSGPFPACNIFTPRRCDSKSSHSKAIWLWLTPCLDGPFLTKSGDALVQQGPVGISRLMLNGYNALQSQPLTLQHTSAGSPLMTVSPAMASLWKQNYEVMSSMMT